MSKSALGRGLSDLLTKNSDDSSISRGVQTIVGGARPDSGMENSWPLVRAALISGDAALLGLSVLIAWRSAGAMTLIEALACTAAIIVGACLAIVAFTLPLLGGVDGPTDHESAGHGVNTRLPAPK